MSRRFVSAFSLLVLSVASVAAFAGEDAPKVRLFGRGVQFTVDDLPESKLRTQLKALAPAEQAAAMANLKTISFAADDVRNIRASSSGKVYYACGITPEARAFRRAVVAGRAAQAEPPVSNLPVPISSPPVFHSRPTAQRKLFLDFNGHVVTGTEWNADYNVARYDALPFDMDGNETTFSDTEQAVIKRVWMRVAEDYAPFDVDVTTEQPAVMNNQTARILITPSTDRTGQQNPDADTAGGIAYVDVFGDPDFLVRYQPAWVYTDNQFNQDDYIAEAVSHEAGHNMGLSHDGTTTQAYYGGHGPLQSLISWGPIMGAAYDRNVTQWSRGEYTNSNNTQDDLAIISGKLTFRGDDHGNTNGTATPLTLLGTSISSTTPEDDPGNTNPFNKGIIEQTNDVDVFQFVTGGGPISFSINTVKMQVNALGNNLDIRADLYNSNGELLTTANLDDQTSAGLFFDTKPGVHYLHIQGVGAGTPQAATPTGYTEYGSLGQYFISGTLQPVNPEEGRPNAVKPFASKLTTPGTQPLQFTVNYLDEVAINVSTLDSQDIRITGPNGYSALATFVSVNIATNGTPRTATYQMNPPGGTWDTADNGFYDVLLEADQVSNTSNQTVPPKNLGTIVIAIDGGAPVTVNDTATTSDGQPVTVNVLANDTGNDPRYVVVILTPPQHGTATVNPDRTITYTPTPGYSGPDSLVYASTDFQIQSASATLSITVTPAAPLITSALSVGAIQGVPFSYTITLTGTKPVTITAAPLPAGTVLQGDVIKGLIEPGSYAVTLTATNAFGSDTRILVINAGTIAPNIDSDGDGFSDEMELAFGSDPTSLLSTPVSVLKNASGETGGAAGAPTNAQPFSLGRSGLSVKLNFSSLKPARDSITLSGSLPMPVSAQVGGQSLAVFIGGVGASGALNDKGQYTGTDKLVKFKVGKSRAGLLVRNSPFTAQLKGIYASSLTDEGLVNSDVSRALCNVPVYVLIGPQYFKATATVSYSAKKDKSGSAKSVQP